LPFPIFSGRFAVSTAPAIAVPERLLKERRRLQLHRTLARLWILATVLNTIGTYLYRPIPMIVLLVQDIDVTPSLKIVGPPLIDLVSHGRQWRYFERTGYARMGTWGSGIDQDDQRGEQENIGGR
jgi:hypothetical protein